MAKKREVENVDLKKETEPVKANDNVIKDPNENLAYPA